MAGPPLVLTSDRCVDHLALAEPSFDFRFDFIRFLNRFLIRFLSVSLNLLVGRTLSSKQKFSAPRHSWATAEASEDGDSDAKTLMESAVKCCEVLRFEAAECCVEGLWTTRHTLQEVP